MMNDAPSLRGRRSRSEAGLILFYAAVSLALLGSVGAGVTLTRGAAMAVTPAEMGKLDFASR